MNDQVNQCVVLAARPDGAPQPTDFRLESRPLRPISDGEALCQNLFVSLDAGFRNWMDEDSGDNVLPAMPLGEPVMGLTLSRVAESRNPDLNVGDHVMGRFAWETWSVTDGSEFVAPLPDRDPDLPLSYYLGVLGDTGLSAYFGMHDFGPPREDETVLVSAAAGAVGSIAGQIAANVYGARTVGITSGADKCGRLVDELGYSAAIDRLGDVPAQLATACPGGVDFYFDNVAGPLLEMVLDCINEDARIVLCGAVATYNAPQPGPRNLFQLVTKHAHMHGLMTHVQLARYPEARATLAQWLKEGRIHAPEYRQHGIERVGPAFCDLFAGRNFGKTVVEL